MANYSGADGVFQQADTNHDGHLDQGEFRQFLGQQVGGGGGGAGYSAGFGAGGAAGASGYESSSFESSQSVGYGGGAAGGAASGYEAQFGAGGAGAGYGAQSSSFESSSFQAGGGQGGYAAGGAVGAGGASFESASSSTQVQQYATDSQGLFQDPNPQIIRRPAVGGVQTYTQNIRVRFLQPPPIPPPGPLIIKEVRPPQPPPPPPLRIRQQAPPIPQPPPLILREKPPQPPQSVASQTVVRRLAALAVPPRSVIIERLPPLPPRPRDVIIERWVPYGAQSKRRTIVQRAAAAQQYARPRNIIIQYDAVQVRVVRQFQRLGVTQANPQAYLQQYGAQLLDAATLLQQARSAGVVEDISPPVVAGAAGFGASAFSAQSGFEGGVAGAGGAAGGEYSSSSFESSGFSAGGGGAAGLEAGFAAGGAGGGYGAQSSSFESSSFQSGGGQGGFAVGGGDGAFAAADANHDGGVDRGEFANFLGHAGGGGGGASQSSFQSASYSSEGAF
ncbi:unnamed protein product [Adineta steineri]|uniref:EF-hand domain-containing protein n=1 Tax=Adineta steineri TaxID=433720 RepID=A0A814FKE6_9BILA|nr:unnamed protein product [Adineta steineri]CAF3859181.1 unnamed protein product [Adineta steineri]